MALHPSIQAAIKGLAVSYNAYNTASQEQDSNGIVVWGQSLIEDQEELGVELHPAASIRANIRVHQEEAAKQVADFYARKAA